MFLEACRNPRISGVGTRPIKADVLAGVTRAIPLEAERVRFVGSSFSIGRDTARTCFAATGVIDQRVYPLA